MEIINRFRMTISFNFFKSFGSSCVNSLEILFKGFHYSYLKLFKVMLILIAESKTMETKEENVSREVYENHSPKEEKYAADIMHNINMMSISEIASSSKLSFRMAERLKQMAYEFPNKNAGLRAIEAFTGVVFRNFNYTTLSQTEKVRTQSKVRIISSLYGWLRPDDIIKPYRLEYNSDVTPDFLPLWQFWKSKVTVDLVHYIQESGENSVLNLLPADAAKCIDWKLVKRFAKVWKVDFLEQNGNSLRTPHAGRLKALRGNLFREIISNDITTPSTLKSFSNSAMLPITDYKYSDRIAFMV